MVGIPENKTSGFITSLGNICTCSNFKSLVIQCFIKELISVFVNGVPSKIIFLQLTFNKFSNENQDPRCIPRDPSPSNLKSYLNSGSTLILMETDYSILHLSSRYLATVSLANRSSTQKEHIVF
uniref:Uncharacterized protein n=1 Tax=Caenorhabditis tropicalis TaxID=1561998 RepID=A0A1I7T2K4_9PELO